MLGASRIAFTSRVMSDSFASARIRALAVDASVSDTDRFLDAIARRGVDFEARDAKRGARELASALGERANARALARRGLAGDRSSARAANERFVRNCHLMGLIPKSERASVEEEFGIESECEREREGERDANAKAMKIREDKIRRFKRRKAIEMTLREMRERVRAHRGGTSEDEDEGEDDDEDEALEREFWSLTIERELLETLDEAPTMRQELEMMKLREENEANGRGGDDARAQAEKASIPRELLDAVSALSTSTAGARRDIDVRSRFAQDVFKPSYALPTMTVEQAGEIEYKEMLDRRRREGEREAEREAIRASKTEEELEDEELYRAREWDAFKDDNPYGSGNSKLRPCG